MSVTSHSSDVLVPEKADSPRRRRWTRAEYHRASEVGLFRPEESLELIRGEVVDKLPQDPIHALVILLSQVALQSVFASSVLPHHVRVQMPVVLSDDSEPEPAIAVVVGEPRDYTGAHPTSADIVLVVEVANRTVRYDRTEKSALYSEAGIAEYWLINIP